MMPGIAFADGALDAAEGADAVVLVTEWDEFKTLDWADVAGAMQGTLLIDGRNALDADAVRAAGPDLRGHRRRERMQAVILVGGEGTRLRPLTSTVPKPVVPLVDRPFIAYMLEWLARPRRRRRDHVVRLPGHRGAQRARRRLAVRAAPALRRGARPARHGRGAEVRRGPARRALPDAQRRRAHRHRPDRADRPARGDRRASARSRWCPSPTRPPTGSCA